MEKLTEILAMGGFAAYVWLSFALTAVIMTAVAVVSLRAMRRSRRALSQLQDAMRNEG